MAVQCSAVHSSVQQQCYFRAPSMLCRFRGQSRLLRSAEPSAIDDIDSISIVVRSSPLDRLLSSVIIMSLCVCQAHRVVSHPVASYLAVLRTALSFSHSTTTITDRPHRTASPILPPPSPSPFPMSSGAGAVVDQDGLLMLPPHMNELASVPARNPAAAVPALASDASSGALLLPARLATLDRDRRASPSAGGSLAPSQAATPSRSRSSSTSSDSEGYAAEQRQQLQLMLAALRPDADDDDDEHTQTDSDHGAAPSAADGAAMSGTAASAPAPDDSDELDYDGGVEEEQRLFAKRSPVAEDGGKGAGAAAAAATSPRPATVSSAERARIISRVLESLSKTPCRAYPFGPADQAVLTEAVMERALDLELAVQRADQDSALQKAPLPDTTSVSDKDVAAYLTAAPLLYADSEPIAAPRPDAVVPLHSDSNQARRVYQQTIQALYLHSSLADFHRVKLPLSAADRQRAESRVESRRRRAEERKQQGALSDGDSDCECEDDEPPTAVSSLTLEADQARAKDPSLPVPPSPLDPSHPALKSLLLTVEAAFDAADRTTRTHASPFQRSVRTNLQLARSVMRMHQARLDAHPTHTLQSFSSIPLFNSWYQQENSFLNAQMNEIDEQIAFEHAHTRRDEEAKRKAEEEAERGKSVSGAATATSAPKRKSSSFWSCCSCGTAEPEVSDQLRMQSKAAASSAGETDEKVVTQWQSDDFGEGMDLLIRVLMQYEHTLDAELDRQDELERQRNAKMLHPSQIDVADLKHPDEMEAEKAAAGAKNPNDDVIPPAADDDESEPRAPIYTSRTLSPNRMRPLTSISLRLIAIYAQIWRVGLPHSSTATLVLYANNLNANNPAYYSSCTNQLTMMDALYRSHVTLTRGAASGMKSAPRVPFTKAELASYKASVRSLFEWVAISLQRYHLVFAPTRESLQRDGLLPASPAAAAAAAAAGGSASPDADWDDSMDGLRECLYLFDKLISIMRELKIPVHTSAMEGAAAGVADGQIPAPASSAAASEPRATSVTVLKKLVDLAITARYEQLVNASKPSKELAAEVEAAEEAAMQASPKLRQHLADEPPLSVKHVTHLERLIKAVMAELVIDQRRSTVFQEVIKERAEGELSPKADGSQSAAASSEVRAHRPSSADLSDPNLHSSGFDLAQVSAATLLTFVWHDAKYCMLLLRTVHAELLQLSHRSKAQTAALTLVDRQLRGIVRLYPRLHDLYALVSRSVANLPDLRMRCTPWFEWAVTAWIARLQSEYGGGVAPTSSADVHANKFQQLLGSDSFAIDLAAGTVRYSSSVVSLFALLWPLGRAFKAAPFTQRNAEDFAGLLSSIVSHYVRVLHGDMSHLLDLEKRKKLLWGTHVVPTGPNATPEVELSLPQSFFARFNDIWLCKIQLRALLDELGLTRAWVDLLPNDSFPNPPATEVKRDDSPSPAAAGSRSPAEVHSAQSPVVARAEMPTEQEKNASAAALARHPVTSPLSPVPSPANNGAPSSNPLLPVAVQTALECRPAFDSISRSVDDLLLRMTAGLGAFIEHQLSGVILKSPEDEWTGRQTRQEIEPLFAYLQRHLDLMRVYLYDRVFFRLLFFVLSDIVLILEKELVHPKKQSYKQRLRTEQVHRVVQMHYLIIDFVANEFKLTDEYMRRLKVAHLNRLEFLEVRTHVHTSTRSHAR